MSFVLFLIGYIFVLFDLSISKIKIRRDFERVTCSILSVLIIITLVYFRPDFIRDTNTYRTNYNYANWGLLTNINFLAKEPNTRFEYGFLLLILLFKLFGFSFNLFSAAITTFSIVVVFVWTKKVCWYLDRKNSTDSSFVLCFSLYLIYFGVFYNFVAIRSCLSFAFLMLASIFAINKKLIKTFVFFLLAFSVQRLSIIGLIPLILIHFCKIQLKRKWFLILWLILGCVLLVEYESHFFLKTIALQIQKCWNSIMDTGVVAGFLQSNDSGLTRLLLFFGYWFNGLIIYLNYERSRQYSVFSIIYLGTLALSVIVCGYSASYRIVDYLYLYSIPLNYYNYLRGQTPKWLNTACYFMLSGIFLLVWGKSYIYWFLFD